MAKALNKNSAYIQSLVSFILDTKPYHSKLTEVVSEYQFFDEMHVHFEETNFLRSKINSAMLFNYFSPGNAADAVKSFQIKQLHSPLARHTHGIVAGRDENHDMANVPFVYSKKQFDGIGVADVRVQRGRIQEPMVEGIDFFQSHGSFQFSLKSTYDRPAEDPGAVFAPTWIDSREDHIIAVATLRTRRQAHDITNPTSAVRRIGALMDEIQLSIDALDEVPVELQAAMDAIRTELAIPRLPRDYEELLNRLINASAVPPERFAGWIGNDGEDNDPETNDLYVDDALSALSPSLYFGAFSDTSIRESGRAEYSDVDSQWLTISNIVASPTAPAGDTWRIVARPGDDLWGVFSGVTGYIGYFQAGEDFNTSTISFKTTFKQSAPNKTELRIENRNRVVFGGNAPLEVWNVIKTNPLAYSRPLLTSTRYGHIKNQNGVIGDVTILDQTIPTGTVVLTARDATTFDLESTVEDYTGVVTVGQAFNDDRLAFTIVAGSAQGFEEGDRFYIDIVNEPAQAIDLGLGYGYDLDSYDHANLKDDLGRPLNFVYDTRFTDYDLSAMNLTIDQSAASGRKWRIVAIPDLNDPIATMKKNGSGPSNIVDQQDSTSGVSPDVPSNEEPLYDVDGNGEPDLRLYRSTVFRVEWSDDDFATVNFIGNVTVGNTFESVLHGIRFTLLPGTKPFIAAESDGFGSIVTGGDTFAFTVLNPDPRLTETPIVLTSPNMPRLIMHGDGFHEAPPAKWTVGFSSPTDYSVVGYHTEGVQGSSGPTSAVMPTTSLVELEGQSFNRHGIHFTIVPGRVGLAATDKFTFDTYLNKPSYLVHGSVSGWQEPATVGKSYWNGLIGFTIEEPSAELFDPEGEIRIDAVDKNVWDFEGGTLRLTRLRFDAPHLIYKFTPTSTGWIVNRSDIGASGHLAIDGVYRDIYVTIAVEGIQNPSPMILEVTADDFDTWNAQDTVIVNPKVAFRLPSDGDQIHIDKRSIDRLAINLNYDQLGVKPNLAPLAPTTIDARFIDVNAGPMFQVSPYSPETGILRDWLPLTMVARDSTTSIAEFSDVASEFDLFSAGSGQRVGTLKPIESNKNWPVEFTWDDEFFATYLPLNAEANLATYGSGFNDKVNARITESVKFLVSGGALTTDSLFSDKITVKVDEVHDWTIFQHLREMVDATVEDGPFGGFLPGYDNLEYDNEILGYDTGIPITGHFHEAKALAAKPTRTAVEEDRLESLVGLLNAFLTDNDLDVTSWEDFIARVEEDPVGSLLTSGFGIPARGMAMDITIGKDGMDARNPSTEGAGASIQEAMVMMAIDQPYAYDSFNYDIGGYDSLGERTAIIYSGSLPPVPSEPEFTIIDEDTGLLRSRTFAEFETPLSVAGSSAFEARVFEIGFNGPVATLEAMPTPNVSIWLPDQPHPVPVAVVDKIGLGRYRISVPARTEAKLIVT